MNTIAVNYDKSKMMSPFLVWSLVFISAAYFTFMADYSTGFLATAPMFIRIVFSTIFLVALMVVNRYVKRLFLNKKPLITINKDGVTDNYSMFKLGLIPWSDIAYFFDYSNQANAKKFENILKLELKEPEQYISKLNGKIKEDLFVRIISNGTSPIFFNTKGLNIDHQTLMKELQTGLELYNKTH